MLAAGRSQGGGPLTGEREGLGRAANEAKQGTRSPSAVAAAKAFSLNVRRERVHDDNSSYFFSSASSLL